MQSIEDWLRSMQLQAFAPLFLDHRVDMQSLPLLTEDDLKEIGLPVGPRKLVASAIERLRAKPQGERRFLTILFGDLVGSSEMARTLDLEDYESVLCQFRQESLRAVSDYGGHVADFAGDGVVAYFGWPEAFENQTQQALRAGLALRTAMKDFGIRVGISSGEVFVGSTQIGGTQERTVATGEAPNRAARLVVGAAAGTILVDETTRTLVAGRFSLAPVVPIQAKGFDTPLACWRLESEANSVAGALREVVARPMLERDRELTTLLSAWQKAIDGRGTSISIRGEAGCGKSRLVAAFRDRIDVTNAATLSVICAPQTAFSAFAPVLAGLRSFVDGAPPDRKMPELLGELMQGKPEGAADVSAQERRRNVIRDCVSYLIDQGADRPFLVIAEDLHWIDPSSLVILRQLATSISQKRLLLVTTERVQYAEARPAGLTAEALYLDRLSDGALAELVRSVAGASLSQDAIDTIVERADGVPLFAEQLALAIHESATGGDKVLVPASLRATLVSRLDRLGDNKAVALGASVIGRRFSRDALIHVTNLPADEVESGLQALASAGLIRREDTGYSFSHALVRDAAYSSLLHVSRKEMHQRMAAWLSEQHSDSAPEIQAHHMQEAGDHAGAAKKWESAADSARSRFAQVEAIELYARALDQDRIATGGRRALDLLIHLGEAQFAALGGSAEPTQATFQRAAMLARQEDSPWKQCTALYGVWVGKIIKGAYHEAMACAQQMFELAERTGDPCIRIAALRVRCGLLVLAGDLDGAISDAEVALALARTNDTRKFGNFAHDPLETLRSTYAQALWARGKAECALTIARNAVQDCLARRQTVNTISYVSVWEIILLAQSRMPEALAKAAQDLQHFSARTGSAFWENLGVWGQSYARILQGEHEAATQLAETSVESFMATGARQQAPLFLLSVAEGKSAAGKYADASRLIDRAEDVIRDTNQGYFLPLLFRTKSDLLHAVGDLDAARNLRSRFLEAADKGGAVTWREVERKRGDRLTNPP